MKTLYVHIGTPKTGTSSIQKFLCENREILTEKGYCYPDFPYQYPNVSHNRNGHFMIAKLYGSDGKRASSLERATLKEGLGRIAELFQSFDNIIVSDESIWRSFQLSHKKLFPRLMKEGSRHGYAVKIIVYLRRQDQFLLSRWNQSVKHTISNPLPWEDYCEKVCKKENFILDYAGGLDQLAGIVGKENIIVRKFDRESWVNGSIIDDFMNCIGLAVTEEYHPLEQMANPRLEGNAIEIKRIINTGSLLSEEDRIYLGCFLRGLASESGQRYPSSMMSPEEIREFLKRYEEGNARVCAEYIGDEKPLFSDEIRDLPKWQPDNPYMTEDVISFFSAVTVSLHHENENQRRELKELRQELKELRRELKELRRETRTLQSQVNTLRSFREKLKHPLRTLWNKLFHRDN